MCLNWSSYIAKWLYLYEYMYLKICRYLNFDFCTVACIWTQPWCPKETRILPYHFIHWFLHAYTPVTFKTLSIWINALVQMCFPPFEAVLELLGSDAWQCLLFFFTSSNSGKHFPLRTCLLRGTRKSYMVFSGTSGPWDTWIKARLNSVQSDVGEFAVLFWFCMLGCFSCLWVLT